MQEIVQGRIIDAWNSGKVLIEASLPNLDKMASRKYKRVLIAFQDGRRISPEQRRKAYALIGDIADWTGERPEETKAIMKLEFKLSRIEDIAEKTFSLASVDMTTARDFITFLIDFMLENDIPASAPLYEVAEDISKYVYACLMSKKCCICGMPADLHHCEGSRIGAGSDRNQVHHLGRTVIPLCRKHHTEAHNQPEAKYFEKYHIAGIKADKAICKAYNLKA